MVFHPSVNTMAKTKLTWFKFNPDDWLTGKIQRLDLNVQALFIVLVCRYWKKEGAMTVEEAESEIDKPTVDILISRKIVKVEAGFIRIDFMDELFNEIGQTSQKAREAAKKRWGKSETPPPDGDKKPKKAAVTVDWEKLRLTFNQITGRDTRVVDDGVKKSFVARLKSGYTRVDMLAVIQAAADDPFHKESGMKYVTLEYISRPKTVAKYIGAAKPAAKVKPVEKEYTR